MAGIFITFEGPDGAGKTTQIMLLKQYFVAKGKTVTLTREPGGTKISEEIRGILLNADNKAMDNKTELLLYAASRAQHVEEIIRPALGHGNIVISDRFSDSTMAYQGYGRGIEKNLIAQLDTVATSDLKPDITFLLDIDVKKGLMRVSNQRGTKLDRLESENFDFHERVRAGFLSLAKTYPERIKLLNAENTPEELFNSIVSHIEQWKS